MTDKYASILIHQCEVFFWKCDLNVFSVFSFSLKSVVQDFALHCLERWIIFNKKVGKSGAGTSTGAFEKNCSWFYIYVHVCVHTCVCMHGHIHTFSV